VKRNADRCRVPYSEKDASTASVPSASCVIYTLLAPEKLAITSAPKPMIRKVSESIRRQVTLQEER
jgi:hypothetical protein